MKNIRKKSKLFFLFMFFMTLVVFNFSNTEKEIKYFVEGKQVSENEFIQNGKNGIKLIYENGNKITRIEFKDGEMSGRMIIFYPDGKKQIETGYQKNIKNGQHLEWHQNNQKVVEGKYEKGKKQGRWLKWDEKGNLIFEESWKNGKIILIKNLIRKTEKSSIYYKNGRIRYEREYRGNSKHGKWIKWDSNGNKIYEREYKDGMKHGKWIEWDGQGNIISEKQWEMGEKIKEII